MFISAKTALLLALGASVLVEATPTPQLEERASRVILGWKGLQSGDKIKLVVSSGGELGRVFYIADSTDLAQQFAITGTHVCQITADEKAWSLIPKTWVSQAEIKAYPGNKMDKLYPGAVLFASHTAAGLPSNQDQKPWQMGIRQDGLDRLKIEGKCYKKEDKKVKPGLKLDYAGLTKTWDIQGKPERGP